MKTIKYYSITIPFIGDAKEQINEYKIVAQNKGGFLCINDSVFTTLRVKKEKHSSYDAINEVKSYKSKWGFSSDGWHARVWFQCSEKVMRRKVLNSLKKEIQKETFLDASALNKLELILQKRTKF
jgi:hypothetical protein